MLSEISVIGSV